jgi:hypothetical protein
MAATIDAAREALHAVAKASDNNTKSTKSTKSTK